MIPTSVRVAALGLAVVALGGCAGQPPFGSGLAANSEDFTISQQRIADEVAKVQQAQGLPEGEPAAGLALATVQRLVQDQLIANKAKELGVVVTQTAVEQGVAQLAAARGGQAALEQAALNAGIPPDELDQLVRTNLLANGIGEHLAGQDAAQSEQVQAARAALSQYSTEIGIAVAPRYGIWDHNVLGIGTDSSGVVQPAPIEVPDDLPDVPTG